MTSDLVGCKFYVRSAADSGGWHYDRVDVDGWASDGALHTDHPPMVGDLIFLWDGATRGPGQCRVLARSWLHSSYGSVSWPHGKDRSTVGPSLDLIVEKVEVGLFVDEVVRPDEDGDDGRDAEVAE